MQPAIGRIVHYTNEKGIVRPAIVIEQMDDILLLHVFEPDATPHDGFDIVASPVTDESKCGWHWPVKILDVRGTSDLRGFEHLENSGDLTGENI